MRDVGELSLLVAFVGSGFAAFACLVGWRSGHRRLWAAGAIAALFSVAALTAVTCILAWALVTKDYRFAYVAQYSSRLLPWHYSLSALWVGQSGSLLLWAWFSGTLALLFGFWPGQASDGLKVPAFSLMMACLCFLVGVMVYAADPMQASVTLPRDGAGLSPLLQHPAMLLHPPIVFLGYALWMIPFALASVAIASGQLQADWVRPARSWALAAWAVLGAGILLGADWAYVELGWGGYWAWDPVENGSLIPWLTGTALIHALMAWQYRGAFKRTAISLAIATFGLCNFATFLTRSGIFSSLHAFSASPIGWLFLALMLSLAAFGAAFVVYRRQELRPDTPIQSVLSREASVLFSIVALLLLTAVTLLGTLSGALSNLIIEQAVMLGRFFYNCVLVPTGLVLLGLTALVPLLRWGEPPAIQPARWLLSSVAIGFAAAATALVGGLRHPIELVVAGLSFMAPTALVGALAIEARRREPDNLWRGLRQALGSARRQYCGFLIHIGFACLALGVTGSSLGTHQQNVDMKIGETLRWAGYAIRLADMRQRDLPDRLVAEAKLEISQGGRRIATLLPARHLHLRQNEWTTEVAIHSTWRGDVYVILRSGDGESQAHLTLISNPMMRWLWLSGWIMGAGTLLRLWPARPRTRGDAAECVRTAKSQRTNSPGLSAPHFSARSEVHLHRRRAEK